MTRPFLIASVFLCALCTSPLSANPWNADTALHPATTSSVIAQLTRDFKNCLALDKPYRYDCYDNAYFRSADRLAGNPAYAPARAALDEVGNKINAIVQQNLDLEKPPIRRGFNTFRPIKDSALPQAKAQVADAIEQAQTILLRAPGDNGDHFVRIADALNSNKVLLRSALLWLAMAAWV